MNTQFNVDTTGYYDFHDMWLRFKWLSVTTLAQYCVGRLFPFQIFTANGTFYARMDDVEEYMKTPYVVAKLKGGCVKR